MAKQAAPTAAPKSARPGTKDDAGKKDKIERKDYAPIPEGGFTEWPSDFDGKLHKPLKRKDFKVESVWFIARAEELEKRAKDYRKEAENSDKLGSTKDRVKAKRLLAMQKRMEELKASLTAEGVDVAALLGTITPTEGAEE